MKGQYGELIIDRFANLAEIKFPLNKINILIGPQAGGKSLIVKLVYFFQSSFRYSFRYFLKNNSKNEKEFIKIYKETLKEYFRKLFPYFESEKEQFKIFFKINKLHITVEKRKKILIDINEEFSTFLMDFFSILKQIKSMDFSENKSIFSLVEFRDYFYLNEIEKAFFDLLIKKKFFNSDYLKKQIFLPSGRSYFAYINETIFSHIQSNQNLDPFLVEFGSFYESIKKMYSLFSIEQADIMENILKAFYLHKGGKDVLVHKDNREVEVWLASSGQQEALPLLLVILYFAKKFKSNATLFIEEPEAHLFPMAQKEIVYFLSHILKGKGKQLFITTHSPYVLASYNNLLYAGFLEKMLKNDDNKLKKLYNIIPKNCILNPASVSAYYLDGQLINLMDKETSLIKQTLLDEVSNNIAGEFDSLLDLEY